MSDGVWVTFEQFFAAFQRLDQAHIIKVPGRTCPVSEKRIAGECRRVY